MDLDSEDLRWSLDPIPTRHVGQKTIAKAEFSDYIDFDWDRVGEPLRSVVKDYIANVHKADPRGYGIFFHGKNYGHGKTSLAVQCALEAMRRGPVGGYFYEPDDLNAVFTQPWNYTTLTGKPVCQKLLDVQFLILDEVGVEITQPKNRTWFKRLIRYRYNKKLVTFITANQPPDYFISEFPWFAAILAERYKIIEVIDQSQRILNAKQNDAELSNAGNE